MNTTRGLLYFVGIALVLASLWIFFVQTDLSRWVPAGVAVAAVVLIVGVSLMSLAEKSPSDRDRGDHVAHDGGVTIVERTPLVEHREPGRRLD